ncbi:MAG: NADH-quinone oxidoreductase subunit NuoH [Gemmatimonadota bacterium]|nr:MAG: NADH-quinone oxidoreductase subunit NuoH [Gemmatimonadota bacterium]
MEPLSTTAFLVSAAVKVLVIFTVWLLVVAGVTLAERKVAAWIQDRSGPNRVGPWGVLQPIADGIKNFVKEEHIPGGASRILFHLAPVMAMFPAFVVFAVIPVAAPLPTPWGLVEVIIADLPIGFLFVLALASLGVYGLTLGGWASNSKYSFLGGVRASAQMISYEVALGLSLVPIFMLAGNVTLPEMVRQQQNSLWYILPLMVGFLFFSVSYFAETNRMPFDMVEAESELVYGFHTEYSAMKFAMFMMAEYANLVTASALMATFFFGGWDIPFWTGDNISVAADGAVVGAVPAWWITLLTAASFAAKTGFFIFVFMWVRWTVPRFRYDQVMSLGWKVLIPMSVVYVAILGAAMLALDAAGIEFGVRYALSLTAINVVLMAGIVFWLDRRRIILGAAWRQVRPQQARSRG